MDRLNRFRCGARLRLREGELFHCEILPISLNVHVVKIIVLEDGRLEFAEWITGAERQFQRKEGLLSEEQLKQTKLGLAQFAKLDSEIRLEDFEVDFSIYEQPLRVITRYWRQGTMSAGFLPSDHMFLDLGFDVQKSQYYKKLHWEAVRQLPFDWITGYDELKLSLKHYFCL